MALASARTTPLALASVALASLSCDHTPDEPTRQMATALLQKLDDAFNTESLDYWELFAPGPQKGGAFQRMRRVLKHDDRLVQASRLLDMHTLDTAAGEVGVAITETTLACKKAGMDSDMHAVYRSYVAFRDTREGPRILLYADVADHPVDLLSVYACPACNFRIGDPALDDWLVVPSPRRVSGCVEMVAFYRLGEDVRMTLSVHRAPEGKSAAKLLANLVTKPRDTIPTPESAPAVEPWTPPFYAATADTPAGLRGAHCDLDLPGGQTAHLYLVSRHNPSGTGYPDELCYLLSVQGSPTDVEARRRDVDTWLASFRLIDAEEASDAVGLASASAHSGGRRGGGGRRYVNETHRFACEGPAGWQQAMRADRCIAGTSFRHPATGLRLDVVAHEYAPGTMPVKKRHVFELVSSSLERDGFRIAEDTGWHPPDATGEQVALCWREIESRSDGRRQRHRVLMFDDLWLVIGGDVSGADGKEAYRELVESVRRL